MIAAYYTNTGPAKDVLKVGDVQLKTPQDAEVRVRVLASGINPADVKRRAGETGRNVLFPMIIPHSDGYGVIDAVGPNVCGRSEGDLVWLWNTQWRRPFGTAAEYCVLPARQTVLVPQSLKDERLDICAALGVPALTAYRAVSVLGEVADKTVLIHGGAGMIGQFAIQFLKRRRGHVVTSVSSAEKARIAKQFGADEVFNYLEHDFIEGAEKNPNHKRYDCVIDANFGANYESYLGYVRRHGAVVVVGSEANMYPKIPVLPFQIHGLTLHFISGSEQPENTRCKAIEEISDGLKAGWLRGKIQSRYGISQIADAHQEVERGGLSGKVIIEMER